MTSTTIDSATKVNLGILITLLASVLAGGLYFGALKSEIVQLSAAFDKLSETVERAVSQAQVDGRDLSANRARLTALEEAMRRMEVRVGELEKKTR